VLLVALRGRREVEQAQQLFVGGQHPGPVALEEAAGDLTLKTALERPDLAPVVELGPFTELLPDPLDVAAQGALGDRRAPVGLLIDDAPDLARAQAVGDQRRQLLETTGQLGLGGPPAHSQTARLPVNASQRATATSTKAGESSMAAQARPVISAAIRAVPEPAKGS